MSRRLDVVRGNPTAPLSHAIAGCFSTRGQLGGRRGTGPLISDHDTCLDTHKTEDSHFVLSGTQSIHTHPDKDLLSIVIGIPRWTAASLQDIQNQNGSSAALAQAYMMYGTDLTSHLSGSFAFAILDLASNILQFGVDRLGRCSLYYALDGDRILFGSSARIVLAMLPSGPELDPQGLYNYVYFHMSPAPDTVFRGVQKLQAACTATNNGTEFHIHRYWTPRFREVQDQSRQAMYQQLRNCLTESVECCLPSSGKVGTFLSGGLDSSTVTGMLAEFSNSDCDAYSIGFQAEGYDEMAYARIAARHFGVRLHEYYVTPDDVVEALPMIARAYDEPFGNSSALPAYFCAKFAASDGVARLLVGDGGDELFAGNERYAKQRVFEIYQQLPHRTTENFLEPIIHILPDFIPYIGKARSYVQQARIPLPDRLQTYNFLHRQKLEKIFEPTFLVEVNTEYPLELQRALYNQPSDASSLNRMLYLDWQITLADNDLRKVNQTCAMAGIEVAYPMIDDRLVEFSLSIPSKWKLSRGNLRDFYKKALASWLPWETIAKSKHGFGLPFGVWLRTHDPLRQIAYEQVKKLRYRGIFRSDFIDEALALHQQGHAAYYGELIWILCILELWLSSHLDNAGAQRAIKQ